MGKLGACKGETLAEMLISMLIISAAMSILLGAALTAAKVSRKTEDMLRPRNFEDLDFSGVSCYVQLDHLNGDSGETIPITVTEQFNGDFYYEQRK